MCRFGVAVGDGGEGTREARMSSAIARNTEFSGKQLCPMRFSVRSGGTLARDKSMSPQSDIGSKAVVGCPSQYSCGMACS